MKKQKVVIVPKACGHGNLDDVTEPFEKQGWVVKQVSTCMGNTSNSAGAAPSPKLFVTLLLEKDE
jgi:hypothetical protein